VVAASSCGGQLVAFSVLINMQGHSPPEAEAFFSVSSQHLPGIHHLKTEKVVAPKLTLKHAKDIRHQA
jgi:hypothetical protein